MSNWYQDLADKGICLECFAVFRFKINISGLSCSEKTLFKKTQRNREEVEGVHDDTSAFIER